MKINSITIQSKGQHPGVLVSWMEDGQLKRKTVGSRTAGLAYATCLLIDNGQLVVDKIARIVWDKSN
jgi:hypothetical protein